MNYSQYGVKDETRECNGIYINSDLCCVSHLQTHADCYPVVADGHTNKCDTSIIQLNIIEIMRAGGGEASVGEHWTVQCLSLPEVLSKYAYKRT